MTPGKPQFYASATLHDGFANGVLVESHEGRPTKIEGNPDHPASLGATDSFAQASVLDLYDPDRAQVITSGNQIKTWQAFASEMAHALNGQESKQGAGLRILTGMVTSPTLADQIGQLLSAYPRATWHQYQPVTRDAILGGAQMAFGRAVRHRSISPKPTSSLRWTPISFQKGPTASGTRMILPRGARSARARRT